MRSDWSWRASSSYGFSTALGRPDGDHPARTGGPPYAVLELRMGRKFARVVNAGCEGRNLRGLWTRIVKVLGLRMERKFGRVVNVLRRGISPYFSPRINAEFTPIFGKLEFAASIHLPLLAAARPRT